MKATIENKPIGSQKFIDSLIQAIGAADTKDELKCVVSMLFNSYYHADSFIYGFGGSHMWVANKANNKRVIFVEL